MRRERDACTTRMRRESLNYSEKDTANRDLKEIVWRKAYTITAEFEKVMPDEIVT